MSVPSDGRSATTASELGGLSHTGPDRPFRTDGVQCAHCGEDRLIERLGRFWLCTVCARKWLAAVAMVLLAVTIGCASAPTPKPVPAPLPPPIVAPVATPPPTVLPVHNEGGHFATSDGQRWFWRGATDFLLLKKLLDGEDIGPILNQRQHAGANLVRVFGMCRNIADFNPATYGDRYWSGVDTLLTTLAARGMYAEITVFADAQLVMPNLAAQQAHWHGFAQFAGRPNLFLELVNENTHAGNTIDTNAFPFIDGILCSHGSNQTDEHPIEPYWHYITYHGRRDPPPDARAATNYAPLVFESNLGLDRPEINDESLKTTDVRLAGLMGAFARTGDGGTVHTQAGVLSQLWSAAEDAAAKAFYAALLQ